MTKMTYVAALTLALNTLPETFDAEARAKLEALKTAQEKRNSAERKPTAKEKETADLREHVVEVLREAGKPMTVSELMETDPTLGEMSNQRVAALLRGLLTEKGGCVTRTEEKRKAYFSVLG